MYLAALDYARRGMWVFPIEPRGKKPLGRLVPHGLTQATTDEDQIWQWWGRVPDANIGISCGPSHLVVIDVDERHGGDESIRDLTTKYPELAETCQAATGGGGWHLLYQAPAVPIRNSTGSLAPGLDVRGAGGYIVAPPSIHPSGEAYEWYEGYSPDDRKPAALPLPVIDDLVGEQEDAGTPVDVKAILAGVGEGERDWRLFQLASKLRYADVPIDWAYRLVGEAAAACVPAFPISEAHKKVDSAYRYQAGKVALVTPADTPPAIVWMTARELTAKTPETPNWIVPGMLAQGVITELSAKIKVGKTTFWGAMAASILQGQPFLDIATLTTSIVLLTEERESSMRALLGRVGLEDEERLHILQHYQTRGIPWPEIVGEAALYARKVEAGLLIVDTLPDWAGITGEAENNAGDALAAMAPLQMAASGGLAVLPVRHDRKGGGEIGDSARGSSAFGGAMDIILGLRRADSPGHENRRVLMGVGRFDGTPDEITIELTDGHYRLLGSGLDVERREAKTLLFAILPEAGSRGLTVDEILEVGGEQHRATLNRALKESLERGEICRQRGYGTTGRAYGYSLSEPMNFSGVRGGEKLDNPRVEPLVAEALPEEGPPKAPSGGPVRGQGTFHVVTPPRRGGTLKSQSEKDDEDDDEGDEPWWK